MKDCCRQTLIDAGDAFVKDTEYEPSNGVRAWLRNYAATATLERHILTLRGTQWGLQHPIACRPDLLACEVHQAVQRRWEAEGTVMISDGRAYVTLTDGSLKFDFAADL